jgi:hypothetical protein
VLAQPLGLVEVLDALGDDLQAHAQAELDEPLDQSRGGGLGHHVGDERAVDLHRVDGQPVQGGDRRVAGAEVVQRQGHAGVGHLRHRLQRGLGGEQRGRLGDLQLQPLRRQAGLGEGVGHQLGEPGLGQVPGGDVDVHAQAGRPGRGVHAGPAQHPGAEL